MTGAICLDILKDQWAAAMTLRTVLLSIQALLAAPEPDDPQDAVVARQYQDNNPVFRQTAQHWAAAYAGSSYKVTEETEERTSGLIFLSPRILILTKCCDSYKIWEWRRDRPGLPSAPVPGTFRRPQRRCLIRKVRQADRGSSAQTKLLLADFLCSAVDWTEGWRNTELLLEFSSLSSGRVWVAPNSDIILIIKVHFLR